jgi:hypothetical protein
MIWQAAENGFCFLDFKLSFDYFSHSSVMKLIFEN